MNRSFAILIFFLSITPACTERVTQEDLIQRAIQIKLDQWKLDQLAHCREEALTKAEAFVDSVLLVTSLDTKLDTIPKPTKPVKPEKPVFKAKPDSLRVGEIMNKE